VSLDTPTASPRAPRASLRDRWFKDVKLPHRAAADLAELQARGSVVFVMRSAAILNFQFLAWASRRLDLAPLKAALGLRGLLPWLFRVRGSPRALESALARGHSGLVFLTRADGPDPFPMLCDLQRRLGRPIFLVPALLVWSRRPQKLRLTLGEILFGHPEAPNRLANALSFLLNRKRALLRLGAPTEISAVQQQAPGEPDALTGRKLRSALHLHLARNFRAAVGPPLKSAERVREQVLRDRGLRAALARVAADRGAGLEAVQGEARADLDELASRYSQGFIELVRPLFAWFFRRKYESIEVDEAGLELVKRAAAEAPLVVCPSHKSYIDFLFLSWLFYENGLTPPHIAAGINLAFWPFGRLLRMGGAFFIRRTVKGDRVYTAVLRAYVKQLLRDRFPQEFFLEGGRSRTGKLLFPKTGLFSMEVDAWLDGAAEDVRFVPVAIDYEHLMEAGSYARELAGGEKQKEDLRGLWKARTVLGGRKFGRIYVQFGAPVSLRSLARHRLGERTAGLKLDEEMAPIESAPAPGTDQGGARADKRELVQHLANTMAFGIAEVITVTPTGLLAAALLSHARRGLDAEELARRVELLRALAVADGARLGRGLAGSPADPRRPGALADALAKLADEGLVKVEEAAGEVIYQVPEEKRPELDFHRNAVLHRFVGLSLVAAALRAGAPWAQEEEVKARARFLSRLLKLEFMYRVGVSFDDTFAAQLATLVRLGAATREGQGLSAGPDRSTLDLFADLTRAFLEAYRISADALAAAFPGDEPHDRKALVRLALERGRAAYLAGRVAHREALSKATLENALEWLVQQGALLEAEGKLTLSPEWRAGRVSRHLADLDFLLR
jgi:glycerol-3-phosphate O-acyltransferase